MTERAMRKRMMPFVVAFIFMWLQSLFVFSAFADQSVHETASISAVFEDGSAVDGAANVAASIPEMTISFSQGINPNELDSETFLVQNAAQHRLAYEITDKSSMSVTLRLMHRNSRADSYTMRLNKSLFALSGAAMPDDWQLHFSTKRSIEIYVSAKGGHGGDGSMENPFHSVKKAKTVVRQLLEAETEHDIIVYLREGTYYVNQDLHFTTLDSPKEGSTVTYRNYPDEMVTIHGGSVLSGWEHYNDGIYRAQSPKGIAVDTLFENDERAAKARFPNEGYLHVAQSDLLSDTAFYMDNNVSMPQIGSVKGLEARVWSGQSVWNWFQSTADVLELDPETGLIRLKSRATYQIYPESRYFLQGAMEFLDRAGEFCLDEETNMLYYYPRNGEIEQQTIAVPNNRDVVSFRGKSREEPVRNIVLEGLTITDSNAGKNGVYLDHCENVTVRNCRIRGTGDNGVFMGLYAKNNALIGCEIYDIGHNGVSISGESMTKEVKTGYNRVSGCYIHHVGKLVGHGAGILLTDSGHNEIIGNRIHDAPRYGISIKGGKNVSTGLVGAIIDGEEIMSREQAYDFIPARNNIIMYNDISNVNTDSQDTGIIENWSAGRGNVMANNHLHDSGVNFSMGYGIYMDDNSDGYIIKNNIVDHINVSNQGRNYGMISAKGVGGIVENNILADSPRSESVLFTAYVTHAENHDVTYRRNISVNCGDVIYQNSVWYNNRFKEADNNLFYNDSGIYRIGASPTLGFLTAWQQHEINGMRFDRFSLRENPLFTNQGERDYRLSYQSPAYKIGFEDIDEGQMGLTKEYRWGAAEDSIGKAYLRADDDRLSGATIRLKVGERFFLDVYARSEGVGNIITEGLAVSYESSNNAVAPVSESGVLSAEGTGKAEILIRVTKDGITKAIPAMVLVDDEVDSLLLRADVSDMLVGSQATIQAHLSTVAGYHIGNGLTLHFAADDSNILSVDENGTVTALAVGDTHVNVTAQHENQMFTNSIPLSVKGSVFKSTELHFTKRGYLIGDTGAVAVSGTMSDGQTADIVSVTYSSSNEDVAEINADGEITAIGVGNAEIIAEIVTGDAQRQTAINEIYVLAEPTDAYEPIQAAQYRDSYGVRNSSNEGVVGHWHAGNWTLYAAVDFGSVAPEAFEAVLENVLGVNKRLEVRLDALDGPVLATVYTQDLEGAQSYRVTLGANKPTGVHDIYIRSYSVSSFNLHSFCFLHQ